MRKDLLIVALGLFAAAGTAAADDLALPEAQAQTEAPLDAPAPVTLPAKGITMAAVKKQFGEPRDKRAPVGGDTPKHPPITRWDYDGFVVIFEKDRVIDAIVPGAPPRLHNTAGLTPATNAPPPPSMPLPDMPAPDQPPPDMPPPDQPPPPDASQIVPEATEEAAAPPMEPMAEAAPAGGMPSMSESEPPPDQSPPPAAEPAAPAVAPAPAEPQSENGLPTPK